MTQTDSTDDFFDGSVRAGSPSIKLSAINDGVVGEIVDQFKVDVKIFGSDDIKLDKVTKQPVKQLVVVLQTDLRGWDRVAKVPRVDPADKNSALKDVSEDDGRRALYVEPYTNLHAAIGKATAEKNGGTPTGLKNGARLGVKVVNLEDTGKGNPKKVHVAMYEPPAASSGDFFAAGNSAGGPNDASQAAPAQAAPSAPAEQAKDPWSQPAPAAPAGDPWGTPAPAASQEPPF